MEKQKTIGSRITFIVSIGLVGFIVLTFTSLWGMRKLSDKTHLLYQHPYTVSNSLRDIKIGITAIHRNMKDVALAEDLSAINAAINKVQNEEEKVLDAFNMVEARFLGDKKEVLSAKQLFVDWRPIRDEVIQLSKKGDKKSAAAITKGKGVDHIQKLNTSISGLVDFATNKGNEFHNGAQSLRKKTFIWFSAFCTFIILLVSAMSFLAIRKIKDSLDHVGKSLVHQSNEVNEAGEMLSQIGTELLQSSHIQSEKLGEFEESVDWIDGSAQSTNQKAGNAASIFVRSANR